MQYRSVLILVSRYIFYSNLYHMQSLILLSLRLIILSYTNVFILLRSLIFPIFCETIVSISQNKFALLRSIGSVTVCARYVLYGSFNLRVVENFILQSLRDISHRDREINFALSPLATACAGYVCKYIFLLEECVRK